MHFERLPDADDLRLPAALALYGASFPPHEQRQTASQRTILQNAEYHFDLVYDGETWVGLMLNWETADFIYVEHFCISPEKRNHQYGARALKAAEYDAFAEYLTNTVMSACY